MADGGLFKRLRKLLRRGWKNERIKVVAPSAARIAPETLSSNPNLQLQSPLFNTLPNEIRNYIFRLACTAYEDIRRPLALNDWCHRPSQRFCLRIDCALLRTCRRAYNEARLVPVAMNRHTFWYSHGRAPQAVPFASDVRGYFAKLEPEQKDLAGNLHVYSQQCAIQEIPDNEQLPLALSAFAELGSRLREFRLTLRHTDWWYWEQGNPLDMSNMLDGEGAERFKSHFLHVPLLEKFDLEVETIAEKQTQLDVIVARFKKYRISLGEGRALLPLQHSGTTTWVGPGAYDGTSVAGNWHIQSRDLLQHVYVVQTVHWRARDIEERS
ncbi:hypothetical protein MMC25_006357 [Agyrium rufum]|nr:hypothetical protein [Agyrium rufum]